MSRAVSVHAWFATGWALLLGACATSSSFRGDVEFGAFRLLSDVDVPPKLASMPDPTYPEVQLAQGIEGTAEIAYTVNADGAPEDIKIVSASDPAFGMAAERAVRRLEYVPARKGLKRVRCAVALTFFFRIH